MLSLVFSKAMFTTYQNEQVMASDGNLYLLQYGSYISKNIMEECIKKLDDYIIYYNDDKYYVHLGAYTNLDTALKMQEYFENKNIYTYLKNDYISDMDIIDKITQIDQKVLKEKDFNKYINYNKKILEILKSVVH